MAIWDLIQQDQEEWVNNDTENDDQENKISCYYSYHIVYYIHTREENGAWSIYGPLRVTHSLGAKIESDFDLENIEKDITHSSDPLKIRGEFKIVVTDFKLLREDWH